MIRAGSIILKVFACISLAGCDGASLAPASDAASNSELERAAIDAGIIVDPANLDLAGLYEAGSELNNDRFCAVRDEDNYKVGLMVYYGSDQMCAGQGQAVLDGESVLITIAAQDDDEETCEITAIFDGEQIAFPGSISNNCARLCSQRASMAGVSIPLVESGSKSAARAKDAEANRMCSSE